MRIRRRRRSRASGSAQHAGSSASTSPLPSSSMQLPQISVGPWSHLPSCEWAQTPPSQRSIVQASPSLQSASTLQVWQPGIWVMAQLPSAPHASVVQGLWSSQSAAFVQCVQPGTAWCSHMPLALQTSVVQALLSPQSAAVEQGTQPGMAPPPQTPLPQTSPFVQALPSLHGVPSSAAGLEQTPVCGSQVPAAWHWSSALQTSAVPVHAPPWQLSPCVQALLSLQAVPSTAVGFEHVPACGSQVPATWHWSDAVQTTAVPAHVPPWQLSPCVQALPSLQPVPSAAVGFEHVPVCGSQVPATWHWSDAVQTTAVPAHVPPWQLSPWVQALPSLQAVPSAAVGFEHVPVCGSQVPATWHWSDAVQTTEGPAHVPPWQLSPWVQALPSLQAVPSAAVGFEHVPVCGSQVPATWHWSDAVQTTAVPAHVPPWQLSPWVQALPSLQAVPSAAVGFEHVPVCGSQVPAT